MPEVSRRTFLKATAQGGPLLATTLASAPAEAGRNKAGWIVGALTGAVAVAETLRAECVECVFGIPGAQQNELWDAFKQRGVPYLLCTHEQSASMMADGYARASGKTGVISVVPGPGITNALTGIGEALLDSVPMVCLVGDISRGCKAKAFQVHDLPNADLLRPVTKEVLLARCVAEIPLLIRQAFVLANTGEPGPVAVVIPYNLLLEVGEVNSGPLGEPAVPFDEAAVRKAICLLSDTKQRVGIYAGFGCISATESLREVAELLQAPVATTISGKGVIDECHRLACGFGYGPQGTATAETVFRDVDWVLAIGVKFGEVPTGFYSIPTKPKIIQVDINEKNLGRVVSPAACVHADAGLFLNALLAEGDKIKRCPKESRIERIAYLRAEEHRAFNKNFATCGVDPGLLLLELRKAMNADALYYIDVAMAEHFSSQIFTVRQPRTYFNPADNQAMGWSIPAALGGQRAFPCRQTVALVGDGCFLMTAVELATAAREGLPVKVFVLDDQAYHYMQVLQKSAYQRTTATMLPKIDYPAFAQAVGVGYNEIRCCADLTAGVQGSLMQPGPILTRVITDYGDRPCRWISAVRKKFIEELDVSQKVRMATRLGARSLQLAKAND